MRLSILTLILSLNCLALPKVALAEEGFERSALHGQVSGLRGLIVGAKSFDIRKGVLKPFVSDGCSLSPDGPGRNKPAWVDCCVEHDLAYWVGGTLEQKKQADEHLGQCIAGKGYPKIAKIYKWGVGIGGSANLNTYYRWGYGWNYLRPYSPLNEEETAQAEALYGPGLSLLRQAFEMHAIPIEDLYNSNAGLGTEDISVRPLSNAEVEIYNYLKENLAANDVVKEANFIRYTMHSHFLEVNLKQCSGLFRFEVDGKNSHLLTVAHEGSCLKKEAP